ncbi:FKBP-like peptidyl-prolyl cis-trans isomerase family protein [Euphorbia peplus]|nr:FKBP-like peptidyl-prolyl cis-trans isomerase family protein [Euphorbia peplus]
MASITALGTGSLPPQLSSSSTKAASPTTRWRRGLPALSLHHFPNSPLSVQFCAMTCQKDIHRRDVITLSTGLALGILYNAFTHGTIAMASEFADMPAIRGKDYGKSKMRYPDYVETESGLQYKDLRVGDGPKPKRGETVVVDWDGYTIGYYGRIFEARNKTKGGSFEGNEKDFFKFKLGYGEVIPAFEEAVSGMALGGVRRIVVPPELGYPGNDYNNSGPRPTTFSGQRALDFVLRNQGLIDKTLLFDIELLNIIQT